MKLQSIQNFSSKKNSANLNCDGCSCEKKNKIDKRVALASCCATLLPVLALGVRQGKKLNKDVFQKSGLADKGKALLNAFTIDYGFKEMMLVGLTSILGGTAAGVIFDKKTNPKKKIQEGINKAFALTIPAVSVVGSMALTKKAKMNKNLGQVLSVVTGVGAGMPVANKISNTLNKNIFKDEDYKERKIKPTDYLMHFDDIVGAMVLSKVPLHGLDNMLTPIYAHEAYEIGTAE